MYTNNGLLPSGHESIDLRSFTLYAPDGNQDASSISVVPGSQGMGCDINFFRVGLQTLTNQKLHHCCRSKWLKPIARLYI